MVRAGPIAFFAGMLGLDAGGRLVTGPQIDDETGRRIVADLSRFESHRGFAAQCWAIWRQLQQVCGSAALSLEQIAKTTVFLRTVRDIWIYEEIREAFLSSSRGLPAIEFVAVQGPAAVADAHVQVEAIATLD